LAALDWGLVGIASRLRELVGGWGMRGMVVATDTGTPAQPLSLSKVGRVTPRRGWSAFLIVGNRPYIWLLGSLRARWRCSVQRCQFRLIRGDGKAAGQAKAPRANPACVHGAGYKTQRPPQAKL